MYELRCKLKRQRDYEITGNIERPFKHSKRLKGLLHVELKSICCAEIFGLSDTKVLVAAVTLLEMKLDASVVNRMLKIRSAHVFLLGTISSGT